jgi:kynurenine formamidase
LNAPLSTGVPKNLASARQLPAPGPAPAHFHAGGATLEALPLEALIGPYLWVDLDQTTQAELEALEAYQNGETILFLASAVQTEAEITQEVFGALLRLPCPVWAITNGIRIIDQEAFYFNRELAEAGKFLIEDLDESAARRVKPGGRMIALPLRLPGVTGSPCRVVVLQEGSNP